MNNKIFKILLDGELIKTIKIANNVTIGDIKSYFENYLLTLGKDPLDYSVNIYLDKLNKLDVGNTTTYDDMSLKGVWGQIVDGYIVLSPRPEYFKHLYTDAIYQIALQLDLDSLVNFCQTDKRLSKICSDDKFWLMRFIQDFGIFNKVYNMTWKELYRLVVSTPPNDLLWKGINDNQVDLVALASARGADIHAFNNEALRIAILKDQLEIVKYLVENGDSSSKDLSAASQYGRLDIVKYLVENGADISAHNDDALVWASQYGHLDVVKYFVENGADARNIQALKWARQKGHLDVAEYLESFY